jgi:hypothetical protein
MQANSWSLSAVECPGHTPGWDESTLVTDWSVSPLAEGRDTAQYVVSFKTYGSVTQDAVGPYLVYEPADERDTMVVVRKSYGWRIGGFEFESHQLPLALRGRGYHWRGRDRAILDSLIASGARRPRPGAPRG